uniref:Uncharacterized protein n=1 Tax=Mycena chlorophos TaxID=658473 RepID=A0ABQ0LZQ5_MYCCL|nr:predicted protein [Mycena chlorophos]
MPLVTSHPTSSALFASSRSSRVLRARHLELPTHYRGEATLGLYEFILWLSDNSSPTPIRNATNVIPFRKTPLNGSELPHTDTIRCRAVLCMSLLAMIVVGALANPVRAKLAAGHAEITPAPRTDALIVPAPAYTYTCLCRTIPIESGPRTTTTWCGLCTTLYYSGDALLPSVNLKGTGTAAATAATTTF